MLSYIYKLNYFFILVYLINLYKYKIYINMNINKPKLFQSSIKNVQFGKNVKIVEPVNLYDCIIGDNVIIGPFTEIQKDVVIGNNTSISSHSFICSGVKIGNDCFIAHGIMFTNDKFDWPENNKINWIQRNTTIGNNVRIGGQAGISGHLKI